MQSRHSTLAAAIGVAGLLAAGLMHLHRLRFEAGDVYPAYSTFRADPLGAKAYFESLARLPGVSVERGLRPLPKLDLSPRTTYLSLGDRMYRHEMMAPKVVRALEALHRDGGRLVITLVPRAKPPSSDEEDETEEEETEDAEGEVSDEEPNEKTDDESCEEHGTNVVQWLGLGLHDSDASSHGLAHKLPAAPASLPASLPCHTVRYFAPSNEAWKVLYTWEERAVVMERAMGNGSVVVSSLSFVVSNEGLRDQRYPAFLAWLIGDASRVVFDETHHGIQRHFTMMTLARAYGVEYVMLTLALLAGLFIWKQSVGLLPPAPDARESAPEVATGKGSAAGLVHLLRRSVPREGLIDQALAECRHEHRDAREEILDRIERMDRTRRSLGATNRKNIVEQYNRLQKLWKEKR